MPKTLLARNTKPPIDWVLAAILERKVVYGYDLKKMASIANIPYERMRKYATRQTSEWSADALYRICREFNIKIVPVVDGKSPSEGVTV